MSDKRPFWFRHIEAWQQGELSQAEYARQHELSLSAFGYYRHCYLKESKPEPVQTPVSLLPVNISDEAPLESSAPSKTGITLTSPGGFLIELAPEFDPQALQTVLRILEAA